MAEVPWHLVLDDIGRRAEALKRKKTNADRIRAMTDEELAHFLEMKAGRFVSFYQTPAKNWLDWLRQEVNDGKEEKEENQPAK